MIQEPEIVNVLRKHPDGATVETLAKALGLVYDKEVRNRINSARRGKVRYNVVRIAENTFQLQPGVWPGRGR